MKKTLIVVLLSFSIVPALFLTSPSLGYIAVGLIVSFLIIGPFEYSDKIKQKRT